MRGPCRQHGSAREDGRAADPRLDCLRRLRAAGIRMTSFADRLRGVIGPIGRPEGRPLRLPDDVDDRRGSRDFIRSGADPSGPRNAADVLGGQWRESHGRKFLVVDRKYSPGYRHGRVSIADALPPWPRLELLESGGPDRSTSAGSERTRPPLSSDRLLFLDLETTGLAGGAGSYAFLVGCGWFDGGTFRLRQFFL